MGQTPRVIKADQLKSVKISPFNPSDTLEETEKRVERAREEVSTFQEAARKQAEQILEQSRKEGYQAGFEEGLQKGRDEAKASHDDQLKAEVDQRMQTLLPALSEAVNRLTEANALWQGEWERLGIELACAVASRIIHAKVGEDGASVAQQSLKKCLALVGRCPKVTLFLNPADAQTLQISREAFLGATTGIDDFEVKEDRSLSPGGLRLETEFGVIDADIETQLDRIAQELLGREPDDAQSM